MNVNYKCDINHVVTLFEYGNFYNNHKVEKVFLAVLSWLNCFK